MTDYVVVYEQAEDGGWVPISRTFRVASHSETRAMR